MLDKNGQQLVLGIKPVANKTAALQLKTLQTTLDQICEYSSFEKLADAVITSVKHLLGDRASTQGLFNDLFTENRKAIMEISNEWASLTDDEKNKTLELTVINCQLHVVSNLTIHTMSSLVEHQFELDSITLSEAKQDPKVLHLLKKMSGLIRYF